MKLLLNTNLFFIIFTLFITSTLSKPNVCPTGGPELYTLINDYQSCSYKIIAIKGDNSPIYGVNYEYTEEFDTAEDVFSVQANAISPCEGFDWIADNNALNDNNNDDLGYGYYYIEVIRNYSTTPVTLIKFYLDLRMAKERVIGSPDIKININVSANSTSIEYSYQVTPGVYNYAPLQMNDSIKIWENNFNQSKDFSPFLRNIELTNDFTGIPLSSEKITLTNAGYGFPNQQYTIDTQFTPGQHIDFWHGVEYEFSVNSNIVSNNGINYQARHWNTSSNIGFTKSILIDKSPSFTRIVAYYLPTQPLTVTNSLEGGTSPDNFEITWQNPSPPIGTTWQYGSAYNTFNYQLPTND